MAKIDFIATNRKATRFREDASFIYRCENLAAGLESLGEETGLHHISKYSPSPGTRAVVLHRPKLTPRFLWLIGRLRSLGIPAIADIDDLIIDPAYAEASPAARNGALPLHKVVKQFQSHQRALRLVDLITVSTKPLAEHVQRLFAGKPVALLHNSVHSSWRDSPEPEVCTRQAKLLLYMPGTKSHDRDFQEIVAPLVSFLAVHPEVSLHITGHLSAERTATINPAQLVHTAKVPFAEFGQRFAKGWINLSPLEASPFNDCKSALKIIEAGFWNIPTLCSPNPDASRFAEAGAVVADGDMQWLNTLERMLDDNEYQEASRGLRDRSLALANTEGQATALLSALDILRHRHPLSGILPEQGRWQPSPLLLLRGKRRRRRGLYDQRTLRLFESAYSQDATPQHLLAYLSYQRDLGYPMGPEHVDELLAAFPELLEVQKHKAANLLLESGASPAALSTQDLTRLARHSPPAAAASQSNAELGKLHAMQAEWRTSFAETLRACPTKICVVGNAATLVGAGLGATIDEHDMVVRFNQYRSASSQPSDTGTKTHVWVRAPDLGFRTPDPKPPTWIMLSGANPLYHLRNWAAVVALASEDRHILTAPLPVWKQLVAELKAPPSAGILFLAWAIELLGAKDRLFATGFQLERARPEERYHQALPTHRGSTRHHWSAERRLLQQWRSEGLQFL